MRPPSPPPTLRAASAGAAENELRAVLVDILADADIALDDTARWPDVVLAFIGRDPGARNVYVVSGDSGNGLAHATLAAPLITALIVDGEHPWAALYDPARKRLTGDWLEENANVALQYRDWLAAGDSNDVAALPPGQGAVIRHGLHRFALYRNEDGSLSALSARCPHLGCAVRWNALERSWDCPCHGSRFAAADGHVLNGPARSGLEPLAGERVDGVSSAA